MIGSQDMSFASDQQEVGLQVADAVSTPGQQELPTFGRNKASHSKHQKPHDHTLELGSYPSDSHSVGGTASESPAHQPAVSQTHSNYLPVYASLTTESPPNETAPGPTIETNKGLEITESVRKVEPLQDTSPHMDSPVVDKTLARNQTSVYETSLRSDSSVDETSNNLPENETLTNNLPIIPPPSSNPLTGTVPPNSRPPLELPSSYHSPEDETSPSNCKQPLLDGNSPSNMPLVDETSSSKHPPTGGTSPSSHPPIMSGTSPSNHPSVDKTPPSQHPPMSHISPISSHSPVDESQPSQHTPAHGTSSSNHSEPPIIDRTSPSNHPSGDIAANGKCLPMDKPPLNKHPLTDFSDSQQSVNNSLFGTHLPVEVQSRTNHPDESNLQVKNELPASNDDQTHSNHLPVCKTSSEFFSSQVTSNIAHLSKQPPSDDKPCDKQTQHKTPSISREKALHEQSQLPKTIGFSQSTPVLPGGSSIQTQDAKLQLFRSASLRLTESTDIIVSNVGDKEGTRFSLHYACMIGDGDMTQYILNSGINPNIQDIFGYTALHYACRGGHFTCVNTLLCHSDDPVALLQVPSNDGTIPLSIQSETSGESLLHFACKHKDKFVLQKLLQSGADPNAKDNSGLTPLMSLALSSVASSTTGELVAALHSNGCNLNAALEVSETNLELQPWNGRTALHMAIENVDADCIKFLISRGASIQATDAQGHTPLHIACIAGYFDILYLLAPNEDYFQIKDSSGCMPLYYVCRFGYCEYFRKVLSHSPKKLLQAVNTNGATPLTVVDEDGRTILHHACREGYDDVTIDLLEADSDPFIQDSQGYTPLHYACENGHDKCVQAIFSSTKDPSGLPEIKDTNGRIPLHIVCMWRHHHIIRILQPSFEHFLISDGDGCTPFYYICINGDCQCIAAAICDLMSYGYQGISSLLTARMNTIGATPLTFVDEENQTMLHHACRDGYDNVTSNLLKAGADPTVPDSQSYTPLHYACKNGHDKCVKAVFHSSVKPFDVILIQDASGCTPLHTACKTKHYHLITISKPILEHLLIKNNDGYTPLYYICHNGDWEYIERITVTCAMSELMTVKLSTDGTTLLTVVDEKGQTMLLHACRLGINKWAQRLLEAGADPSVQDSQGNTPLHYACERGDIYCVRNLLHYSQNPSTLLQIKNKKGVTPLSMWIISNSKLSDQTILHLACEMQCIFEIRKLLEVGANPNVEDGSGFTPLMRVITSNLTDFNANAIVALFCEFNCDVNLKRHKFPSTKKNAQIWEGTALHMAAKLGSKPLCVQTLTAQCTTAVDIRDDHGRIPLHIAAINGHHNLMKYLGLAHDHEYLCTKDIFGCTPLYYACKNGDYPCIMYMFKYIPINSIQHYVKVASNDGTTPLTVADANDKTALHHASQNGDLNLACKLVSAGADLAIEDRFGYTPLTIRSESNAMRNKTLLHHFCCEEDIITFNWIVELLKAGADPNVKDIMGYTPLMLALKCINDTSASRILTAFCGFQYDLINITTTVSQTALHIATENNKAKCVELLIAKGANLLARNSNGKNPLHIACMKGHSNIVAYLLTDKSIAVKDITGSTPLHYACKYGHIECVRKIISIVENDHLKALFQMTDLEGVTPLEGSNNQGETILHHTCAAHDLSLVQDLLRYGACPNAQDNAGLTPLMTALKVNLVQSIENLLLIINTFIVSSIGWDPHIKDRRAGQTVLHYAAGYEDIRIAYTLLVAGCDTSVEDDNGQTFSNLMPSESLQLLSKQLLRIDCRQIVCVIGYPKSGKTTLIAAFKQVPRGTLQKVSAFFQNDRIIVTDTRTAGIDTTTFLDDKLGNVIFFDFAGQSEYYASHLAFLESALAPKGAAITFIMVVDLRLDEEQKFRQCMEWLFPIKSITKEHNILNVVLIGSHQDHLTSGASTAAVHTLYTTMQKLKTTLSTPCLQFVDCWGMDCRRLSSKGMARLQKYLISRYSSYSNSDAGRHAPIGASLLFYKLKNSDNPPLAITPCMIIDKLKNGHHPFPLTVTYIDRCCQDLSAAGIVLYFLDREDAGKSWLILEIEEILSRIHGKLFAPNHTDFPMHHKNLANQFGLVQTGELKVAFKHSPLDPDMVQRLLISMEFCHPIDSSLMKEGNSSHIGLENGKDVVEGQLGFLLNEADFRKNWLFFPSLVKADRGITMSTECDVSPEGCHWVCWELSTVTPHFLTPRFQQTIFIRLAYNYVQKHKSVFSSVEEHSCAVSKNAMSWSTIHGVDVCVKIKYKSTVNVIVRSRPGVKVSFLMELIANVVSDILTARANHSPGVDVFSVFRVMDKGTPTDYTVPISSIIASLEENGSHVNCREQPLKLISLKDLFLDWEVSTTLLKKMHMSAKPSMMDFSTMPHVEHVAENEHDTQQTTDDVNQPSFFKDLTLPELYSGLILADTVKTSWKSFAQKLGVFNDLIEIAEKVTGDIYDCSGKYKVQYYQECLYYVLEAWMMKEEGTGDLPRTWETVLFALENSGFPNAAAKLKESPRNQHLALLSDLNERKVTEADLLDLVESQTYEKWNEFAIHLGIQQNIREEIAIDSQRVAKDNFIEIVYRWLSHEDGTGDNPRTWVTVVKALREIGCPILPENLKRNLLQYQKSNGDSIKNDSESSQRIPNDQEDTVTQTNLREHIREEESTKKTSTTVAEHSQEGGVNGSGLQQNQKYIHVKPSEERLVQLVGSQMCAKWNMFSLYLGVQKHVRDEVSHNCQRMAKSCFMEVVGRWLSSAGGTGDSPRTWETVFSALGDIGHAPLAEEVKQKLFQSGALATVTALEEKSCRTLEAIRSDFEDAKLVINDPLSLNSNSVQTEAKQDDLPSLLESIEREEITTRPCPAVTIHEQLPCELEDPTTSMEDEEDDCDTQQKQTFLQMKPTEEELARFVGSQMCAEWNTFSVYLGVQKHVRDKVCYNCPRMAEDCFIEVVGRWLSYEDGTGINCRTWETVFSALKGAGYPLLVEEVKQKLSNR